MRRIVTALAALSLALGVAACGGGEAAAPKDGAPAELRIGYQSIPNGDLIVKDQKWLEQALPGTEVRWSRFDSGADVNTAMISGAIDIGLAGTSLVTAGLSAPLNIPYQVPWIFDVIGDNEALVVRKGVAADVKGLAGKKVATPFGSTTHYSLLAALTEAGMAESSVQILNMEPPDIQAAWQRGDIDAAYVWTPVLAEIQKTGTTLVTSRELAGRGKLTADLAVVRTDFATKYPAALRTWLQQQDRAVKLVRSDKPAAAAAVGRQLNLPPEEASRQLDQLVLLDATEQASADYLGTPEAPGKLADVLHDTAGFLKEQKKVGAVAGLDVFRKGLATKELSDAFPQR